MKDQVLSIEQMQHLKELGVAISPDSNYMNYCVMPECGWNFLSYNGIIGEGICRTFTLEDMIEMIPAELYLGESRNISLYPKDHYVRFSFHIEKSIIGYVSSYKNSIVTYDVGIYRVEKTALESVYHMLCWLAEKEMKEKAMIAFCRASCGELCWDFDLDNKCDELEEFIELLDE